MTPRGTGNTESTIHSHISLKELVAANPSRAGELLPAD